METEMILEATPADEGLSGTEKAVLVFAAIGVFVTARAVARRVKIKIRIRKDK